MKPYVFVASLLFLLQPAASHAQVPGGCETPRSSAPGKTGCYFSGQIAVGTLPQAFWHIDAFPTIEAARAAATPLSYAAVIFGKAYLQTVNADRTWRPSGGTRVSIVGPLPVADAAAAQTARFMEADTTPEMVARNHEHSGPEAWYLLEGGQCVETPAGVSRTAQGQGSWVAAGPPMQLSNGGAATRKALVLVLHPAGKPWMTMMMGWQPKGLCLS